MKVTETTTARQLAKALESELNIGPLSDEDGEAAHIWMLRNVHSHTDRLVDIECAKLVGHIRAARERMAHLRALDAAARG